MKVVIFTETNSHAYCPNIKIFHVYGMQQILLNFNFMYKNFQNFVQKKSFCAKSRNYNCAREEKEP